jgi:hypothetical protein
VRLSVSVCPFVGGGGVLLLKLYVSPSKSLNIPAQRHFFCYALNLVKWVDLALQATFKPLGTQTLESGSLATDLIKILKL